MESQIKFDLLLKLAEHLEEGELGHKTFDFSTFNGKSGIFDQHKEGGKIKGCGSAGCAIGELPILFPDKWEFRRYRQKDYYDFNPYLIDKEDPEIGALGPADHAEEFFGLSDYQCQHLFLPNSQLTGAYGGINLGTTATKEEVAGNIRAFILKMHKQ